MVFDQSQNVYHVVVRGGGAKPFLEGIEKAVNGILPHVFTFDINAKLAQFVSYVSDNITKIFTSTVSAFYSFLLMLFIIFHFLKDGEAWRKGLIVFSPLPDEEDEKIIGRLSLAINAVMKGYLLVALVQGILMGFGLWIFHVPNPALWGVVAAVASLIPTIGTALVSVPAIIFLGSTGHTALALGLLAWAVVVVGMIDNVLSPYVVGKKINTPSLFILFSVLGGISVLGPAGILVGPLAVSLLFTLISIYRHDFN
jgi:predicted PurR-regulated permease PerM